MRGAYNKMIHLSDEEKKAGVVACSAGNHAQGVAYPGEIARMGANVVTTCDGQFAFFGSRIELEQPCTIPYHLVLFIGVHHGFAQNVFG